MTDNCSDCPDFATCKELCDRIRLQLEELPERSPDQPISQIAKGKIGNADVHTNESNIDDFRSIDPAGIYRNVAENEIEWDLTSPQPVAADIHESERQLIDDVIKVATRMKELKFRRRFRSFLRCEKMVNIAFRSGTTKQNIQKQFQRIINKVHQRLAKRDRAFKSSLTPYKFKQKLGLSDT